MSTRLTTPLQFHKLSALRPPSFGRSVQYLAFLAHVKEDVHRSSTLLGTAAIQRCSSIVVLGWQAFANSLRLRGSAQKKKSAAVRHVKRSLHDDPSSIDRLVHVFTTTKALTAAKADPDFVGSAVRVRKPVEDDRPRVGPTNQRKRFTFSTDEVAIIEAGIASKQVASQIAKQLPLRSQKCVEDWIYRRRTRLLKEKREEEEGYKASGSSTRRKKKDGSRATTRRGAERVVVRRHKGYKL